MSNICVLRGRGDNCTCDDCVVLYGGECWTTKINDALDKFDDAVEIHYNKNKNLSHYQLYKIITPIFKTIKKDCVKLKVSDLDNYYKMFMPLMFYSWGKDKNFRDSYDYKYYRYSIYRYIVGGLERNIEAWKKELASKH